MNTGKLLLSLCLILSGLFVQAQNGLESIYVERYYVSDANDALYSHPAIPLGSVTYRIYADMLPGYKVQSIYGSSVHSLLMNTSTYFFNQEDYGATIPTFSANNAKKNTVMLDSWLSTGGACNGWNGIPKPEDNGVNNFVNSNVPPLLQNNAAQAGIPLTTQDGMIAGTVPSTITLGLDGIIEVFGDGSANGNSFLVNDGAWACLSGAAGPDPITNKVLIAQITTDGIFHFELNIQIGTPSLGTENYVATNPEGVELTIPSLIQTLYPVPAPPTVSITSPANGATFAIGAPINITADANDADGTVSQVEFFVDGTSIGADLTAPYEAVYTGTTAASHVLTAVASDNEGQSTISAPVNFNVVNPLHNVTFIVDMSRESVSSDGIHIAGDFNSWNPSATPMIAGSDDIYYVTLPLSEGQEYSYRFVNGNSNSGLEIVPAECGVPAGSGLFNRVVNIPSNDITIDTVCFSMCVHCPADIPVTFRVDMTYQAVSPNGVHLAGTFNDWNTSATPMTAGSNNLYSATVMLPPGTMQLFRFVNGNDASGYESVPSECGSPSALGGYDRYFTIPDSDTTLTPVCFSSCVECGSMPQFVSVTFRVDMHHEFVSSNGVHIAGSFQGWQPESTPMITSGDTVYTYTQTFLSGTEIQYRFVNGNTSNDLESVPAECAANGNRHFTIPATDTILNLVCFSSCEACAPLIYANVTFSVDMSLSSVSPEGVHIMSNFQAWNPASTIMAGSGNIYSITLLLPVNAEYEYKFVNGITLNDAEIVPSECSQNGNRHFLSANDTILPLVCFSRCVICDEGMADNINQQEIMTISPNPFGEIAQVSLNLPEPGFVRLQVFDNIGRLTYTISEGNLTAGPHMFILKGSSLKPGFYYCRLNFNSIKGDFVSTLKIIHK